MKAINREFSEVFIGQEMRFDLTVTRQLVREFANLSGDYNPLHVDETFAARTLFKECVAHGMLGGAFFSRLVGMHLPGSRSLYLSQSLNFRKPIYLNTEIVVSGKVVGKSDFRNTVNMAMEIIDKQTGGTLIDGEALVKIL